MGINDIITSIKDIGTALKDETLSRKIRTMQANAEIYNLIGEREIYDLIKKRCVENYYKISDPKIKEDVAKTINEYLTDNIQKNP